MRAWWTTVLLTALVLTSAGGAAAASPAPDPAGQAAEEAPPPGSAPTPDDAAPDPAGPVGTLPPTSPTTPTGPTPTTTSPPTSAGTPAATSAEPTSTPPSGLPVDPATPDDVASPAPAPSTSTPTTPVPEPTVSAEPTDEGATPEPARLSPASPALSRSSIPIGSVVLAVLVLLGGGFLVRTALRRDDAADAGGGAADDQDDAADATEDHAADDAAVDGVSADETVAAGSAAAAATGSAAAAAAPGTAGAAAPPHPGSADPATLDFLLALGEALVDAGHPVNHVQDTVHEVAAVYGVPRVGVVVMATAVFISLPHGGGVQTQVAAPGTDSLRLDQVDAVFRVVDQARRGLISPADGRAALAAVRASDPPFSPALQLLGYVLFTLGLVLILRGGGLELLVGGGLGVLVGALHLASDRLRPTYRPFLPVVAALGCSAVVLSVARVLPDLAVFPPLVAALVAFLPGALLTTAVFELSTGQVMSGSGRLAAGLFRLVLLAVGILAGAQLVGVPGAAIDAPAPAAVRVVAPWLGVAVFGCGVVLFKGARSGSLRWILLVLYVAYAGQVLGGLFFGSALSAFFGALVLAPVATIAARQESGPPALVSFLPAFWLLVPGAVGLEGVTRVLDDDTAQGVSSLITMGTSMVAIALGVLAGLAVSGQVADHVRLGGRRRAGDLSREPR